MAAKEYSIYNKTRESSVTSSVTVINSAREPLAALRVMVEGLGSDNTTGLWLTHVTSFPMVPRLSPFDLIYLDKNNCVVERFELLPVSEMPRFKSPASSALVLPFQTISSARIDSGDEFLIDEIRAGDAAETQGVAAMPPLTADQAKPGRPATFLVQTVAEGMGREGEAKVEQRALRAPAIPETPAAPAFLEASTKALKESEVASSPAQPASGQGESGTGFSRRGKRKRRRNRQAFKPSSPVRIEIENPEASNRADSEEVCAVPQEQSESIPGPPAFSSIFASIVSLDLDALAIPETVIAPHRGSEAPASSPPEPLAIVLDLHESRDAMIAEDSIAMALGPEKAAVPFVSTGFVPPANSTVEPLVPEESPAAAALVIRERRRPASLAASDPVVRPKKLEPRVEGEKSESANEERKPVVHRILSWLYPSLYKQDRRHSQRRPLPGLVAYENSSDSPTKIDIGNISSSGIYLITERQWEPGELISLTLQRTGPFELAPERRVDLYADPVRWGSDGIGLSFVWPEGMDLRLWEQSAANNVYEAEPDYIVREMRMARALALLNRICPPVAEQAKALLYTGLSNVRVANAVEICLKAERLLSNEPEAHRMLAHPDLTIKILEDGSWVDVESIQQLWAGLLATACTIEGQDESNRVYINLLSLLAPIHTRILSAACHKAVRAMADNEVNSLPHLVASSPEEMARLTGSTNLMKVHRSIAELSELGLLEKTTKTSTRSVSPIIRTKPTNLGLEMYARCNGQRGAA
jgi:hypothetical protein